MPFSIVRDDLVHMSADAIVLPSNERLIIDGGTGLAVGKKAGLWRLRRACKRIGHCPTGGAVHTRAFSFPARYMIHAVGPVWGMDPEHQEALLRSAYDAALALAAELDCESVAMPLLSAGTYGCPAEVSLALALDAISSALEEHELDVTLVLYDRKAVAAGLEEFDEIASFIDDRYVENRRREEDLRREEERRRRAQLDWQQTHGALFGSAPSSPPGSGAARSSGVPVPPPASARSSAAPSASPARRGSQDLDERTRWSNRKRWLDVDAATEASGVDVALPSDTAALPQDASFQLAETEVASAPQTMGATVGSMRPDNLKSWLSNLDEGFSVTLLKLIDERGLKDSEVYKRANISRQLFSKIRNDPAYRPTKKTALALAVALELDLDETNDLLSRAGLAMSKADKFDMIVEFYILRGMYDIIRINEALYSFDQPLLG